MNGNFPAHNILRVAEYLRIRIAEPPIIRKNFDNNHVANFTMLR